MNENPPAELQRRLKEYSDYKPQADEQRLLDQDFVPDDDIPRRLRKFLSLLNS